MINEKSEDLKKNLDNPFYRKKYQMMMTVWCCLRYITSRLLWV